MLRPLPAPMSACPPKARGDAIERGVFGATEAWHDVKGAELQDLMDPYMEAKALITAGRNPFPAHLLLELEGPASGAPSKDPKHSWGS